MPVIDELRDLSIELDAIPKRPREVGVLMARPTFFDVEYVINPHMAGHVGQIDRDLAMAQWSALVEVYRSLGFEMHLIDGVPGLPDLVFTANQSFPGQLPDGRWIGVRSNMFNEQRVDEVDVVASWYADRGASMYPLSDRRIPFEGMGDGHWHPGRRLIWGGHGFRTDRTAWTHISARFEVPVIALELIAPAFYHLDTALAPLDERTALVVQEAFEPDSLRLIHAVFDRVITVDPEEAAVLLACNGHCPDGQHFIVQRGAKRTIKSVEAAGFTAIEVDTGEFLKSGGSVFCMKLMIP